MRFLIHDGDAKFATNVDTGYASEHKEVIVTRLARSERERRGLALTCTAYARNVWASGSLINERQVKHILRECSRYVF